MLVLIVALIIVLVAFNILCYAQKCFCDGLIKEIETLTEENSRLRGKIWKMQDLNAN